MKEFRTQRRKVLLFIACSSLSLSGCGTSEQAPQVTEMAEVSVIKVQPRAIEIADELPGRVVPFRIAEIRPQVTGIIQRRLFEQGSEVRLGQALFQINAAPFRADADVASANVEQAKATLSRAQLQEQRLAPLVKTDAVSGQTYDDAVTARQSAVAALAQARAQLKRQNVDVGFATIRSPISGRIDQAVLTEGALAAVGDANALATVQQIDRVYIDVRQPAARLEALRTAAREGESAQAAAVEILLGDGRPYPVKGKLLFSGISVDAGTGQVVARVEIPNFDRTLLPGMFVRARLPRLRVENALTVPVQAVAHDGSGKANVSVVDAKGKVSVRSVATGDERDGQVVVLQGLKPGDLVVVEGQDRAQPGSTVRPVAWRAPSERR